MSRTMLTCVRYTRPGTTGWIVHWTEPGRRVTGRGGRRSRKAWAGVNALTNGMRDALLRAFEVFDLSSVPEPDDHPDYGYEEPPPPLGYRERRRQAKLRRRRARAKVDREERDLFRQLAAGIAAIRADPEQQAREKAYSEHNCDNCGTP